MRHAFFSHFQRSITLATVAIASLGALAVSCSSGSDSGTDPACNAGRKDFSALQKPANGAFCAADAAPPVDEVLCALEYDSCGVALREPPGELTRSSTVKEFKGSGPPKVSCYDEASPDFPKKVTPSGDTVTLQGEAKIFSHGCESDNLTIEFYTVKRTGGADDGMPDKLVGTAVTTPDDCVAAGVQSDKDEGCSANPDGKPYHCTYTYPDVPMDTEMLVKTSGKLWASLYEYNVFVPSDPAPAGGMFKKDIRALAQDDYNTISQAAIGASITATHGAVAGEVHDCEDVRLTNAVVDIDVPKKKTVFFSSDEEHPLPAAGAKGTSILGLYAAIDVKEGPVVVSAVGLVDGKATTIGFFKARVFKDSVTSVTLRGLRPFQVH